MLLIKKDLNKSLRNFIFEPKVKLLLKTTRPVLVWTMGKVGSTSMVGALRKVRGISVFTSHFMNEIAHPRSVVIYRHLIKPQKPLKILTLVRDPIGKNVSSFFQNYERNTGATYVESGFTLDELVGLFFDKYQHHYSPLNWFDNYIKFYTGIDVYSKPFPLEEKAYQFRQDNFELLVMRYDLQDTLKASCIERFLELESGSLSITPKNVGAAKRYSKTYYAFKQHIRFPEEYVNKMIQSKYFNHFYGPQEIKTIVEQWNS